MPVADAATRLGEFDRIARFFAPLALPGALDLSDDVALIDGPEGEQYVLTTDTIVESIDYFPDDPPFQVAQKLLRVNLSDLAAKGARPFGYLLNTALPVTCGEAWLAAFTAGLAADQKTYGIGLLGGDSTAIPGPTSLTVMAIGRVAQGKAILRGGAGLGETVYVSGSLGDSALGLQVRKGTLQGLGEQAKAFLIDRYRLPQPRLVLGQQLVGIARAMIDISDGLIADLGHLCKASGLGAVIEADKLPLSAAASAAISANPIFNKAVIGGGDDYELLFTAPADATEAVAAAARAAKVTVTAIGRMDDGGDVRLNDAQGRPVKVDIGGYTHF
jgi:thiamine-monophosphate kinase